MKNRYAYFCFILVAMMMIAACAKPPTEEMNKAEAAVFQAQSDSDVAVYAPGALARARDSLEQMHNEAEAKRYDAARVLALDTVTLAEKAVVDARSAAIRARDEAANAIAVMENVLTETSGTLESARNAKKSFENFAEMESALDTARAGADAARNANIEKRYREAIDTSNGVRAQLSGITAKIGQESIMASRKK